MYMFLFYDCVFLIFSIYFSPLNNCLLMRREMKDIKKGTPLSQRCHTRRPGRLRILAMEREGSGRAEGGTSSPDNEVQFVHRSGGATPCLLTFMSSGGGGAGVRKVRERLYQFTRLIK